MLVDLIQISPWTKNNSNGMHKSGRERKKVSIFYIGKTLKYEDGKWQEIEQSCNLKLVKVEGQVSNEEEEVWMTICHLLGMADTVSAIAWGAQSKQV